MEHSKNWKALQARLRGPSAVVIEPENRTPNKPTNTKPEELWFEVDEKDLKKSQLDISVPRSLLEMFPKQPKSTTTTQNRYIAMDCEYVGVGAQGKDSALARLTLVNWYGAVLLDVYVRPKMAVTDFRTAVSGIRPHHLHNAVNLDAALVLLQEHVTMDTILIGHGLENDMRVMLYHHPRRLVRDTSKYRPFRAISRGKTPGLKRLVKHFLSLDIQTGEHDSVEDARAAMLLYQSVKAEWENYLFRQDGKKVKAANRQKRQERDKRVIVKS